MSRRKRGRREVITVTGDGWPESTPAADFEVAMLREHLAALVKDSPCQHCGRELPNMGGLLSITPNGERIKLSRACWRCTKTGNREKAGLSITFHAPNLAPILDRMAPLERVPWLFRHARQMGWIRQPAH